MSAMGLTERQQAQYDALVAYVDEHDRPPSVRELAAVLGVRGTGHVHDVLSMLKERGYVDWIPRRPRSLRLLPHDTGTYMLPPKLQAQVEAYCKARGETPAAFVEDAVTLALDTNEHCDRVEAELDAAAEARS
jgi:SOS-response transcriptional repressor LexA